MGKEIIGGSTSIIQGMEERFCSHKSVYRNKLHMYDQYFYLRVERKQRKKEKSLKIIIKDMGLNKDQRRYVSKK